jgi:hypothetical protein
MHYDSPQWSENGAQTQHDQTHAILFIEPHGIPIGATSFSRIKWQNAPPGWRMSFVWIAEPYRRHGHLTKRWPGFHQTYGSFTLEYPLSDAMHAFAKKRGGVTAAQHGSTPAGGSPEAPEPGASDQCARGRMPPEAPGGVWVPSG